MSTKIPTRLYLSEDEIPRYWYNVRADMKEKPAEYSLWEPEVLVPSNL